MVWRIALAGTAAGIINGVFGAGGGIVLVPLLTLLADFSDEEIFPASISIILPICVVTLLISSANMPLPFVKALPYLIGSAFGGIGAGILSGKVPTKWLHRILGIFILYGGWRYLC